MDFLQIADPDLFINCREVETMPTRSFGDDLPPTFPKRPFDREDDAVCRVFLEMLKPGKEEIRLSIDYGLRSVRIPQLRKQNPDDSLKCSPGSTAPALVNAQKETVHWCEDVLKKPKEVLCRRNFREKRSKDKAERICHSFPFICLIEFVRAILRGFDKFTEVLLDPIGIVSVFPQYLRYCFIDNASTGWQSFTRDILHPFKQMSFIHWERPP